MSESYATQLIFVSSINTAETFLRDNFFKPEYVKAVERLIIMWRSKVTNKDLINMMKELQQEEINKLK